MSRGSLFSSDLGASTVEPTSPSLIERVRTHTPDAWRTLVAIYSPLIYSWCRRAGVASGEAADVAQEVFRSVARHVGQFRRDRSGDSFRGWLYTITRNKARDHIRRNRGRPHAVGGSDAQLKLANLPDVSAADDHSEDETMPPGCDDKLLVAQVLEQLRGEFGHSALTAFWRMVVDGHPATDIAGDLNITPKAVRQAKYRVLRRLREELRDLA